MSYPTPPKGTQDEVREQLLKSIADNAKRTDDFTNQVTRSEALKNLAEAYAFLISPNQPH